MLGCSPESAVVWPFEFVTVRAKVVRGEMPIECEAISKTP
jgi:hypothetical protein